MNILSVLSYIVPVMLLISLTQSQSLEHSSTLNINSDSKSNTFPNLEGVPVHLRDKILQFHKTLNAPDNFSPDVTPPPPPSRPKYGVAGLQELKVGEVQTTTPQPQLSLQKDLFRFSDRLSNPAVSSSEPGRSQIYSSIANARSRRKTRLEGEWRKFLKWRKQRRRKRRMRKRIMKMLKRKIEGKFGPLSRRRWKALRRNKNFRSKRKDINKKINQRFRQMRQGRKKSPNPQRFTKLKHKRPRAKRRKMKRKFSSFTRF